MKKFREVSIEGCELIGSGASGDVYRIDDDTAVKVYRNPDTLGEIELEQNLSRCAFVRGIPTVIPFGVAKIGDKYGSLFELADAQTLSRYISEHPQELDGIITKYADFLNVFHSVEFKPGDVPTMKDIYISQLAEIAEYLPGEVKDRLICLLRSMPDDFHALHGDIQPNNVMISGSELTVIDLGNLSIGNRVFDFGTLFMSLVAFNESYPENAKFLGLDVETDRKIYSGLLHNCFGDYDSVIEDKIKVAGYMRMIYVLAVRMPDTEKYRDGIENAVKNLTELCGRVDSLAI